jgi:hypothetical protein
MPILALPVTLCPGTGQAGHWPCGLGLVVEDDEYGVCLPPPSEVLTRLRNLHPQGQIVHSSVCLLTAVS